jgi:hypothetical protein
MQHASIGKLRYRQAFRTEARDDFSYDCGLARRSLSGLRAFGGLLQGLQIFRTVGERLGVRLRRARCRL